MIELTDSQFQQLFLAAFIGLLLFIAFYVVSEKWAVSVLVLLAPFQLVESAYGTNNMVFVYVLFACSLLKDRIRSIPLLVPIVVIFLSYSASLIVAPGKEMIFHISYIVQILSSFLLFFIVINYCKDENSIKHVINLLVIVNVLIIVYCIVLLLFDDRKIALFGVNELSLNTNRSDNRLRGPFRNVGTMAEYAVIQTIILFYLFIFKFYSRSWITLLMAAGNIAILIATANRGGFVVLILGVLMLLVYYFRYIKLKNVIVYSIVGLVVLAGTSIVVVKYTKFNTMFDRLAGTSFEEGLPDTRAVVWPLLWSKIEEKPILGHGPVLKEVEWSTSTFDKYDHPHNLYLYLMYTLGITGLLAYCIFWIVYMRTLFKNRERKYNLDAIANLPSLGLIVLVVFFIDQNKVEFLRQYLVDYQHYIYILLALFLSGASYNYKNRIRGGRITG